MSAEKVVVEESQMPELVEDEEASQGGSDNGSDAKDWDDWNADGDDEEEASQTKCVACSTILDSVEAALAHMKDKHAFDLVSFVQGSSSDISLRMYNFIKVVNYLRAKGDQEKIEVENEEWKDEKWLKSAFSDDPLLTYDLDDAAADDAPFHLPTETLSAATAPATFDGMSREELEKQLASSLKLQSATAQKVAFLEQQLASLQRLNKSLLDEPETRKRSGSASSSGSEESSVVKQIDEGYFGSYAGFQIHEDMLKDKVRTEAYRDFIEGNPELFKDKIVMDVGCGTSILSMFAIRAGAKHVIAIDNSGIIERAKEIAAENGMADKITFIRGKAEQIESLGEVCEKVDIIISEWMGYCLLFESMLPSVLFVRDRWLKPNTGLVFPDISNLHLSGMSCPEYRKARVDFWRSDVYGFKMESIAKRVHFEPHVDHMQNYQLCTSSYKFFEVDANTVKVEQLDFTSNFEIVATNDCTMDAFITHFDIGFTKNAKTPIWFTTSSSATDTHWRQTVLLLEQPFSLSSGQTVSGTIELKANRESFRDLDIHLHYRVGTDGPLKKQSFFLQ